MAYHETNCKFCEVMADDDKKKSFRSMGSGPDLSPVTELPRRDFDSSDFRRTRIAPAYSEAKVELIQDDDIRNVVSKYISDVLEMITTCTGLIFTGPAGVGKSACAAMIGMEAVRCGRSVLLVNHTDLQEWRFDKPVQDDDGRSHMERVKSCDLLIIDNLNEDCLNDKIFGPAKLEKLISTRNANRKTTIVTTRFSPEEFNKEPLLKSLYGVCQETMVGAVLSGTDMRQVRNQEMKRRLGLIK